MINGVVVFIVCLVFVWAIKELSCKILDGAIDRYIKANDLVEPLEFVRKYDKLKIIGIYHYKTYDVHEKEYNNVFRFQIGDVIEGEYETLKIVVIGKENCLCEVMGLDSDYERHHLEIGEEVCRQLYFIDKRYGLIT